jgi:hypothetical protein
MDEEERANAIVILRQAADMYTAQGDKDYYTNLADILANGGEIPNFREIYTHAKLTVNGFVEGDSGVQFQ